ncbi:MAG: hypothetical protein ACI8UR_000009 [Natronomonas sp.]|jgi:hypothetical protein|uniref:DUF3006 domain-containing protein n=1 Tax=Natronomonas sp. TaxID=2184060 RepID=UPI0039894ABF
MRYLLALALFVVMTTSTADTGVSSNQTAVIDRIVGDKAVLLIESDDRIIDQRSVQVDALPKAAREDGAVLRVRDDGYELDRPATASRSAELTERIKTLTDRSVRPGGSSGQRSENLCEGRPLQERSSALRSSAREGI